MQYDVRTHRSIMALAIAAANLVALSELACAAGNGNGAGHNGTAGGLAAHVGVNVSLATSSTQNVSATVGAVLGGTSGLVGSARVSLGTQDGDTGARSGGGAAPRRSAAVPELGGGLFGPARSSWQCQFADALECVDRRAWKRRHSTTGRGSEFTTVMPASSRRLHLVYR